MCGIACLEGTFVPKLTQKSRPPKNGGWTITDIPDEALPEPEDRRNRILWGWKNRKRYSNANGLAAVNEMLNFLRLQDVAITREIKEAIKDEADNEWCAREPDRCPGVAVENIRPEGFGFGQAGGAVPCPRGCAGGRAR